MVTWNQKKEFLLIIKGCLSNYMKTTDCDVIVRREEIIYNGFEFINYNLNIKDGIIFVESFAITRDAIAISLSITPHNCVALTDCIFNEKIQCL